MNIETFANNLEAACTEAAAKCRKNQCGRYGGLYVARIDSDPDNFEVLADDDPESTCTIDRDIYAHVTDKATYAIGSARCYLDRDGCVDRDYLGGKL